MSEPIALPDYIDAIVAWRGFAYFDMLGSLNGPRLPLPPRRRTEAVCRCLRLHECPERNCSCGFYAVKDPLCAALELASAMRASRLHWKHFALAQVYLWGKVLEFERGYRAQFCYPKTILTVDARETRILCERYRCEEERSCTWESLFESTELSLFEIPSLYGGSQWMNLSRSPLLVPTLTGACPDLPTGQSPNPSEVVFAPNRSHPKLLRTQIAQKEAQAKSDFWKRL